MTVARTDASAIRMADGRVFIVGGGGLASAEIFKSVGFDLFRGSKQYDNGAITRASAASVRR
jgi:hypothetical protein